MSVKTESYRKLMTSLTERLRSGERDIDVLVHEAKSHLQSENQLTQSEIAQLTHAARRDLREFARIYDLSHAKPHRQLQADDIQTASVKPATQNQDDGSDSVFLRVIKESLWQQLADITDKTQLEWKEVLKDVSHHGVYHSGEVVGLGNMVCEKCHFQLAIYTPEVLTKCPECGNDAFSRQAFEP